MISREEAIEIACATMGAPRYSENARFIHTSLGVVNGKWQIGYSDPLGLGWTVTLNAQTGEVEEKCWLPGR